MMLVYVITVSFFFFTVPVNGMFKRWTTDANFDNPKNWNAGRVPCGNDVVIIQEDSAIIYMQTNTSIKELQLPKNSEIILASESTLRFTDAADTNGNCQPYAGELTYEVINPRKWIDPRYWCTTDTQTGTCKNVPLLDTEKIPCATDDVLFPKLQTYLVTFGTGMDIKMGSLNILGSLTSTQSFQQYLQSPEGKRMFPVSPGKTRSSITISRKKCTDLTGCACGNDKGEIFNQICKLLKTRCNRALCKNALRPAGTCCDLCGGVLTGVLDTGFRIAGFKTNLMNIVNTMGNQTVQLIVSKTGIGTIQAVLTGKKSIIVATAIKKDIDDDLKAGGHKYALKSIKLAVSLGNGINPPAAQTGQELSGGSVAGIVIGLLVVIALVVIIGLFMYKKKTGKGPNLPKLPSLPTNINPASFLRRSYGSASGTRSRNVENIGMNDQGFPNPLYGDIQYDGNVREMELIQSEVQPTFDTTDDGGGFNNPLYDTVGKTGFMGHASEGKGAGKKKGDPDGNR